MILSTKEENEADKIHMLHHPRVEPTVKDLLTRNYQSQKLIATWLLAMRPSCNLMPVNLFCLL